MNLMFDKNRVKFAIKSYQMGSVKADSRNVANKYRVWCFCDLVETKAIY
jgi:hypothetical protein